MEVIANSPSTRHALIIPQTIGTIAEQVPELQAVFRVYSTDNYGLSSTVDKRDRSSMGLLTMRVTALLDWLRASSSPALVQDTKHVPTFFSILPPPFPAFVRL